MQVFLSYSRRDAAFVGRLADDLETHGIDSWLDTDDLPTDDEDRWRRSVIQGIRASSSIILVLSPDSVRSEAVEREVTAAAEMSRRIIPILHRPCELPDSVLFELAGVQRTDFVGQPYNVALDQLVTRLRLVPTPSEDEAPTPAAPPGPDTNAGTPPAPAPIGTFDRAMAQDDPAILTAGATARPSRRKTLAVMTVGLLVVAAIAVVGVVLLRDDSGDGDGPRQATSTTDLASTPLTTSETAADGPDGAASDTIAESALVPWDEATAALERRDGTAITVKAATVYTACTNGQVELTTGQKISLELVKDIQYDTIYTATNSADGTVTLLDGRVLDDPIYTWNCPIDGTNDLGRVTIPLDEIRGITFHRDPAAAPESSASDTIAESAFVPWVEATAALERRDGTATTVNAATVGTACSTGKVQLTTGQTISLELVHDIQYDTIYTATNSADGTVTLLDGRVLDDPIYTWNCPIEGTNDLGRVSIPLDEIRRITFRRDPAAAEELAAESPESSVSDTVVAVALVPWVEATAALERRDGTATTVNAATVGTACSTGKVQLTTGQTISLELVHDIVFDTIYTDSASADGTVTLLDGRVLDDPIYTWNCPIEGTNDLGRVSIPLDDIRRITFHR